MVLVRTTIMEADILPKALVPTKLKRRFDVPDIDHG